MLKGRYNTNISSQNDSPRSGFALSFGRAPREHSNSNSQNNNMNGSDNQVKPDSSNPVHFDINAPSKIIDKTIRKDAIEELKQMAGFFTGASLKVKQWWKAMFGINYPISTEYFSLPFLMLERFYPPVMAPHVTSWFGDRLLKGNRNTHFGIDIVPSIKGKEWKHKAVYSVLPGTVAVSGFHPFYGNVVIVWHPEDPLDLTGPYFYVMYAHLSFITVHAGQNVYASTPLGLIGNTGSSHGVHLHMGFLDSAKMKVYPSPMLEKYSPNAGDNIEYEEFIRALEKTNKLIQESKSGIRTNELPFYRARTTSHGVTGDPINFNDVISGKYLNGLQEMQDVVKYSQEAVLKMSVVQPNVWYKQAFLKVLDLVPAVREWYQMTTSQYDALGTSDDYASMYVGPDKPSSHQQPDPLSPKDEGNQTVIAAIKPNQDTTLFDFAGRGNQVFEPKDQANVGNQIGKLNPLNIPNKIPASRVLLSDMNYDEAAKKIIQSGSVTLTPQQLEDLNFANAYQDFKNFIDELFVKSKSIRKMALTPIQATHLRDIIISIANDRSYLAKEIFLLDVGSSGVGPLKLKPATIAISPKVARDSNGWNSQIQNAYRSFIDAMADRTISEFHGLADVPQSGKHLNPTLDWIPAIQFIATFATERKVSRSYNSEILRNRISRLVANTVMFQ